MPDDIESIEIVKGPAAATLYGIQASNGVVRITTKHGTAGPPQWNLFTEFGAVSDNNTYPLNYYGRDSTAATGADFDGFCNILANLAGDCTQTQLQAYQALNNPATRPYRAGLRQSYGANVSGGSDQVTYFVSGAYENEIGPFRLPKIEEDSVRAVRGTVQDNQLRPNALEKYSVRANVNANVSKTFDVDASIGFLTSNTRRAREPRGSHPRPRPPGRSGPAGRRRIPPRRRGPRPACPGPAWRSTRRPPGGA